MTSAISLAGAPGEAGVGAGADAGRRVAMVAVRYPPFLGGVETHVHAVARRMAARGVDVTVLTTDPGGTLAPWELDHGVEVRRFPVWPGPGDLYLSPALVHQVATGGYDVVHVQGVHTLLPPLVLGAARRAGAATVVTLHTGGHSSRLRHAARGAQWRALRPALRRADALVAVCDFEARRFSRLIGPRGGRVHRIANGAEVLPTSGEDLEIDGSPLVVSVGRLERYKGHHRLIAAMPALRARAPGARLVVVGRGPYEEKLRRLAARLGVERAVTFTAFDHDRRAELGALVARADALALLSDYEAHPVAVMEALALGRSVVVGDGSGLDELERYLQVRVVPRRAPSTRVADALVRAAAAPPAPAPALPTWDDCADRLLELYDRVRVAPAVGGAGAGPDGG